MSDNGNALAHHELPELAAILREATRQVEDELSLEDQGWLNFSTLADEIITDMGRIDTVKTSRLYYTKDPLAKQAIRLWTDYTFGTGMTWSCEDKQADKALSDYWNLRDNQPVLSAKGQRRMSTKLLVDGELFIALFLGTETRVRLVNPLEITAIITDPDDRDDERFYKREWFDTLGHSHIDYYPSHRNVRADPCKGPAGQDITVTDGAKNTVIYHLPWDNLGQRGYPLLTPAIDWIKQYRRFLASRVAIMLALARFAWDVKTKGGAASVAAAKAKLDDQEVPAGSAWIGNEGVSLNAIKTDTGARNAYDDGRMLKLQVAAACGIPEQYFGDISIGNLATAKTVELPMMKMFQSYQQIWWDAFRDIDEVVLEHSGIATDTPIDRDFPAIAPEDVFQAAQAISTIITAMPEMAAIRDVQQVALLSLGINNVAEVLDSLDKQTTESMDNITITKALRLIREAVENRNR